MKDLSTQIIKIVKEYEDINKSIDIKRLKQDLKKLETQTADPSFWENQENAKKVMQEIGDLKKEIEKIEGLRKEIEALNQLRKEKTIDKSLHNEVDRIENQLEELKISSFLSGPYDKRNSIIGIHAGQGGIEAMDWTSMLYRMYLRYCEKKGWKTEQLELSEGEEAGTKSVTFSVEGMFSYGYLKGEVGTHRLVRQSPFNADRLRQTSFALVEVLPELEDVDLPDIEIKDSDLEWQFFRASTQGGQNVQKVSTAVRLKHVPSGVVVTSQAERHQEQNRKIALNLLRSRLWLLAKMKAEEKKQEIKGKYRPASWGTQIRSYVLHPYKMVKDLRTNVETSDTEAVLDGDLDIFIEEEIKTLS